MSYKKDFIVCCVMQEFLLCTHLFKSGRKSPYFINTGNYKTGEHTPLGRILCSRLAENGIDSDVLWRSSIQGYSSCC